MTDKDIYLAEFTRLLHRFTLKQLEDKILEEIELPSLMNIRKTITTNKLPPTKKLVIKVIVQKYLTKMSLNWLREKVCTLLNLAVAKGYRRHKWFAYQLCKRNQQQVFKSSTTLRENIESLCVQLRMIVDVGVTIDDGICWISMLEKRRGARRRSVFKRPIYVGYIMGQPYFFISHSGTREENLKIISTVLGYKKSRNCRLHGQKIQDLYKLLKTKERGASSYQEVLKLTEYKEEPPKEGEKGIDFIQKEKKNEYINECLPSDLTQQQLVISSLPCPWSVQDTVLEMDGEIFETVELTIQSPDLMKMFNELAKLNILPTPLPAYVKSVKTQATNFIKVK